MNDRKKFKKQTKNDFDVEIMGFIPKETEEEEYVEEPPKKKSPELKKYHLDNVPEPKAFSPAKKPVMCQDKSKAKNKDFFKQEAKNPALGQFDNCEIFVNEKQ